jgi:hypothetical protein
MDDVHEPSEFEKDLEVLLNRHSQEQGSNTPDFILASYLMTCLQAWNAAVMWREKWYGRRSDHGTISTP